MINLQLQGDFDVQASCRDAPELDIHARDLSRPFEDWTYKFHSRAPSPQMETWPLVDFVLSFISKD